MPESTNEKALRLDELSTVETPFLDQLAQLGWQVMALSDPKAINNPATTGRSSFRQVILPDVLETQLVKLNPFLAGQTDQLHQVISRITDALPDDLIAANEQVLKLLLENTKVAENRLDGTPNPVVRYVDFDEQNIGQNDFRAISQFKVQIPGSDKHIKPDIVLFVNGLPIGVVECKSLKVNEPIAEAIDQMMRYANTRQTDEMEGNPALFYYNQLMIATCRNEAKYGTISSGEKHYYPWYDPYPFTVDDIPHSVRTSPHNQDRLIYGMLSKANLLRIIQSFTIFKKNEKGKKIKVVARHQQYRAVMEVKNRLLNKPTPRERSGIIWHTQGSGKSLTMMFMVREMYRHPDLKTWKVVFVTDRIQLEEQLGETSNSIGFEVKAATSVDHMKTLLRNTNSDLVMAMIHKFQEKDKIALGIDSESAEDKVATKDETVRLFDALNPSEQVLVMIDEAHRSQYKILGANLERALPNATRLAFTGTPIDKTEETFQYYIHKYTLTDARRDKVIVDIVYEGRRHEPHITDKDEMNARFKDVFQDYEPEQWQKIIGFSSRKAYLEASETIRAKAHDIIDHYVAEVLPNGFKAQVVSVSKEAAVRYKTCLEEAIAAKQADIRANQPAYPYWNKLQYLEVGLIFSSSHNDKPHLKKYSDDPKYKEQAEASFKLPFDANQDGLKGSVGILVVVDMLLTGFDAPIEQVMYIDKVIRAHNLLQAIARVNRLYDNKTCGYVVDYVGIGDHLTAALDSFKNKEDLEEVLGVMEKKQASYDKLENAYNQLWAIFTEQGIDDITDIDAVFDLFYNEKVRFDFILKFRDFAMYLDRVYPSARALDYEPDFRRFSGVLELAKKHFRDGRMSFKGVSEKLRAITDTYLISVGIDRRVAPISIMDEGFEQQVGMRKMSKTKAAEIEHAIRHFISVNIDNDPELMESFADLMEAIFLEYQNNWRKIYEELEKLRQKIKATIKEEETYGLNKQTEMPFFHTLKTEFFGKVDAKLTDDQLSDLLYVTKDVSAVVAREIQFTKLWELPAPQSRLRMFIKDELLKYIRIQTSDARAQLLSRCDAIVTNIMEKAKSKTQQIRHAGA
jgi:type I restriction enzyme R subunit